MSGGEFGSVNILIIDDDPLARKLLFHLLEKLGTGAIFEAEHGAKALFYLGDESHERVDLIISDIVMPMLDGWGFVRRLRYGVAPLYKDLPVLMLTANNSDENIRKAATYKVHGFIIKPPKGDVVAQLMRDALAATA